MLKRYIAIALVMLLLVVPVVSAQKQLLDAPTGFTVTYVTGSDKADHWLAEWNTVTNEKKWNLKFTNGALAADAWDRIKGSKGEKRSAVGSHGKVWYWQDSDTGKSYLSWRGALVGFSNISLDFKLFVRTSDNNKRTEFAQYRYNPPSQNS